MGLFSKSKLEQKSPFTKATGDKLVAIFDIGSASIGGALVLLRKRGRKTRRPKILYSVRYPITLQEDLNFERFFLLMLETLKEVAGKIKEVSPAVPSKTICFLASPWYAAHTRKVGVSKNTSFVFTKRVAQDLIQKELKAFEKLHLEGYAERGDQTRIIESNNIQVLLNGHKTNKPFGKKIKEVELSLFISIGSVNILSYIEETIRKFLSVPSVQFASFLFPSFIVSRDLFSDQENFLLVDVGGEVTDVSIIKKDALEQALSFPFGKNFLIRNIAKKFRITKQEASSLLSIYLSGHIEESLKRKINAIIQEARETWLNHFQIALSKASDDVLLPETVFLTADNDVIPLFTKAIKEEKLNQYTLTAGKFDVIPLDAKILHSFCRFSRNIERDPFLILESIYLNRI